MQEEFDEFENANPDDFDERYLGEIDEYEKCQTCEIEEFEDCQSGEIENLENVSFVQKDFSDEDVELEDIMLSNMILPYIQKEEKGIFDDVYNLYEKPTWKDRIFFYPLIFIAFLNIASITLLLVNLCNIL